MKPISLLFAAVVSLFSCRNNGKSAGASSTRDSVVAVKTSLQWEQKITELQKMEPYSQDQLKGLLPFLLNEDSLTDAIADNNMGASFARGHYGRNDSAFIELNIFDCAGNEGAGIYNTQYLGLLKAAEENTDGTLRTTSFQGQQAVEHVETDAGRAAFTWLAGGRFLTTLEGKNTGIDLLKKLAARVKSER